MRKPLSRPSVRRRSHGGPVKPRREKAAGFVLTRLPPNPKHSGRDPPRPWRAIGKALAKLILLAFYIGGSLVLLPEKLSVSPWWWGLLAVSVLGACIVDHLPTICSALATILRTIRGLLWTILCGVGRLERSVASTGERLREFIERLLGK